MDPYQLVFLCSCGQYGSYADTTYLGRDGIDHIDYYRCQENHVVQVVYPLVVAASTWQRRKPTSEPPFPGRRS